MDGEYIPVFGSAQPDSGRSSQIRFSCMPKKVVSKWAVDTREAMAAFLLLKVSQQSERLGLSFSDAQKKIGRAAGGLSLSTMQRIMSGDTGPSIDTLSDLAHTLGCSVAEMLTTEGNINQIKPIDDELTQRRKLPAASRVRRR